MVAQKLQSQLKIVNCQLKLQERKLAQQVLNAYLEGQVLKSRLRQDTIPLMYYWLKCSMITEERQLLAYLILYEIIRRDDWDRNQNTSIYEKIGILASVWDKGVLEESHTNPEASQELLQFCKKYFKASFLGESIALLFVKRQIQSGKQAQQFFGGLRHDQSMKSTKTVTSQSGRPKKSVKAKFSKKASHPPAEPTESIFQQERTKQQWK